MSVQPDNQWANELELAFRLARAAHSVSSSQFIAAGGYAAPDAKWRRVADVAEDIETAIVAIVREHKPDDAVSTSKVGQRPGSSGRRWMIVGIDDEPNFMLGRSGWGTSIALEADGRIVVALLSCPQRGRVAWATRGGGAWMSGCDAGGVTPHAPALRLRCSEQTVLNDAVVSVLPVDGLQVGWRNEVAKSFVLHHTHRAHGAVNDAIAVAAGEFDALILTDGQPWDLGALAILINEAGGRSTDAWGEQRSDGNTLVCTNPSLIDPILEAIAMHRPIEPDTPRPAALVDEPLGTEADRRIDPWLRFGLRRMPSMSARTEVTNAPPEIRNIVDERFMKLAEPVVGVTTDGVVRTGLRRLDDAPKVNTAPITDAARSLLEALTPDERSRVTYPLDAAEWRMWMNVHMAHCRHGLLLEDVPMASRQLALAVVRTTLSARGYDQARTIMKINRLLAEISGDREAFGEWPYFFTIFGEPGLEDPWGWQIDGHHLCINALVLDGRLVMTPAFMGAEPRQIGGGSLAGTFLFGPEESHALALIRSLDDRQRARAILHGSIHTADISPLLQNRIDGRMQAGAFNDNAVMPYQGIGGAELTDAQRKVLLDLAASYAGWSADAHAKVKMSEIVAHLDETWFSWYGGVDDVAPFYYRVHSPVVLIEFDHHPGTVFRMPTPTRHHVHTVVRTPSGGDYGLDLLTEHHERFDHQHGDHRPAAAGDLQ